MRRLPHILFASTLFAAVLGASSVHGFDAQDVPTVFAIRKTNNRNRVDYGIRLDDRCRPRGDDPVVPYWRRLEQGPSVTAGLTTFQHIVYGVSHERVARTETGGRVRVRLRALPERTITIETEQVGDSCRAKALSTVDGTPARLVDILVVLDGPRDVNHVEVTGRAIDDGHFVRELLRR